MKALSELGISPWPWKARIECMHVPAVRTQDDDYSDSIRAYSGGEKGEADASLIAAAPEMAKVCYDLIMWDGCRDASICDIVAEAKAAYAKASGEEAK